MISHHIVHCSNCRQRVATLERDKPDGSFQNEYFEVIENDKTGRPITSCPHCGKTLSAKTTTHTMLARAY